MAETPVAEGEKEPMIDALPYTDIDQEQFEKLIAQESHTIEGQVQIMQLIQEMIHERLDRRKARIRDELQASGVSVDMLEQRLRERMANVAIYTDEYQLDDGRNNIIVEMGAPLHHHWMKREERDKIRKQEVTIMVPAHVDVVAPLDESQLTLGLDPNNSDHLVGRGVWDMKGAVLNMLHYIEHLDVPLGMRVYFVFTVDEEKNSEGAKKIIDEWRRLKFVDVVFSNEIGPSKVEKEGVPENSEKIINSICRRGRAKFRVTLYVVDQAVDHGAAGMSPNISKAMRHVQNVIEEAFPLDPDNSDSNVMPPKDSPQNWHKYLNLDDLEEGEIESKVARASSGYSAPQKGWYEFSVATVPPTTIEDIRQDIGQRLEQLKEEKEWNSLGIKCELRPMPNQVSYDPYEMSEDHPVIGVMTDIQQRITGVVPSIGGAPSVADEVLYAKALHECRTSGVFPDEAAILTSQMIGGNAHGFLEWLSRSSVVRHRQIFRNIIEHPDGLQRFIHTDLVAEFLAIQANTSA